MDIIRKHLRKIPLEVGVLILIILSATQNILLARSVSFEAFIFTNLVMLIGVLLGIFGSSIVVLVINFILLGFSLYTLFFQPVIMDVPLKLFYCLSVPVYSLISYEISQSILMRRNIVSKSDDIIRYITNIDSVTGFRNGKSFYGKYEQYMDSMAVRQLDDSRQLGLVMFQIDFYEQYVYQDKQAAKDVLLKMADTLIYTRYPEELFFHFKDGVFIILTPLTRNEEQVDFWHEMNQMTKTQMQLIPFKNHSANHDITIKMGELLVCPAERIKSEQAYSRLQRRTEADLSAEYII